MQRFAAFLFLLLVASAVAAIHNVPEEEPIATVAIPDKWQIKQIGEAMDARSPDGTLHFLVTPVDRGKVSETMGEAMRYIRGTGGIVFRPDSRKIEAGDTNGIDAQHLMWLGKDKSGDVKARFTVFLLKDQPLVAVYWGSPAAEKKYQAALNKMLESLKRA